MIKRTDYFVKLLVFWALACHAASAEDHHLHHTINQAAPQDAAQPVETVIADAPKAAADHVEAVQPVVLVQQNAAPALTDMKLEDPQPVEQKADDSVKDPQRRSIDSLENGGATEDEGEDESDSTETDAATGLLQRRQPDLPKKKKKHRKTTTKRTTSTTETSPLPSATPPTTTTTKKRTTTTTSPLPSASPPTTPTTTTKKKTTTKTTTTTTTALPSATPPSTTTTKRKTTTTTTRRPTTQPEPTTPTTTKRKTTTTTRRPTTQPEPTTPTTRRTTTTTKRKTTHTTRTTRTTRTTQPNPTTPTTRTTKRHYTTTTRRTTQPEPTTPTTTKRKTTTTRRYTTTTLPDVGEPGPSDICLSCADRRNQKDYYANPDDCHSFFHCFFFNETFAIGILQRCPAGTFWNDEVLQCLPEGPVPCFDQCRDDAVAAAGCHAGTGDNCAEFFQCSNGGSQPFCCPPLTRFDQATCSCLADETCTDICTLPSPIPTTVAAPQAVNATVCIDSYGVTLASVAGNPNQFIIIDNSDPDNVINNVANCAGGSQFDLATCRCDIEIESPIQPVGRQCVLWLPFNNDLDDHSIEKFTTFLYGNGNLDTSAAAEGAGSLFVNNGRLEIPGMKNYDFGMTGSWCLFFRCQNGGTGSFTCSSSGGLLSNNNNSSMTDFSVIMATQATNAFTSRLNFRAPRGMATLNTGVNAPVPGWNQVCMTYDSVTVRLYLNGNMVDTEPGNGGYVALGHCPYVVGTDQTYGNFTGNIDEVLACPFVLTPTEITAHFQGNTAFLASEGLIPSNNS